MPKTMLTLKGAAHIRTVRQCKSFRSGRTATGVSMAPLDQGRIRFEYERLARRERHRTWFSTQLSRRCGPGLKAVLVRHHGVRPSRTKTTRTTNPNRRNKWQTTLRTVRPRSRARKSS